MVLIASVPDLFNVLLTCQFDGLSSNGHYTIEDPLLRVECSQRISLWFMYSKIREDSKQQFAKLVQYTAAS